MATRNCHQRVTTRANDAAVSGTGAVLAAMQWDAAVWASPARLALVLSWAFQLGTSINLRRQLSKS